MNSLKALRPRHSGIAFEKTLGNRLPVSHALLRYALILSESGSCASALQNYRNTGV